MSNINFEEDTQALPTDSSAMSRVLAHCTRIEQLDAELEKVNALVTRLTEEKRQIEEFKLPLAMDEANVRKLTLKNGGQLEVKNILKGSLNAENQERGFEWLRNNGHEDLIKREVKANFGRGEDDQANRLIALIKEAGFDVNDKSSVHYQTLNAFIREQMEAGKSLPEDIFTIYKGRQATIKKPKQTK